MKSLPRTTWKFLFFFLSGFSSTDTGGSQDSRGREGTIFYFTLPLPPAHEHSDIYLQLCMWDNYHIFLIAPLVFTRLLLDENYHLIELPFDWLIMWHQAFVCLRDDLILAFLCYSNLRRETGGFELASTITLVLQANRLTKCASHPRLTKWASHPELWLITLCFATCLGWITWAEFGTWNKGTNY